jgi:UDP-N-acetylglucosamine 2-epimerase
VSNLEREGITSGVHLIGDIMSDSLALVSARTSREAPKLAAQWNVQPGRYFLATVHRSETADSRERLAELLRAFNTLDYPIVFPVHPRTRKAIHAVGAALREHIKLLDPVGYEDMVLLAQSARAILTDSGGLQKEAYWLGTPCITLREETEWIETVELGWNTLVGTSSDRIIAAVRSLAAPSSRPPLYGDGNVARKCVALLEQGLEMRPASLSGSKRMGPEVAVALTGVV